MEEKKKHNDPYLLKVLDSFGYIFNNIGAYFFRYGFLPNFYLIINLGPLICVPELLSWNWRKTFVIIKWASELSFETFCQENIHLNEIVGFLFFVHFPDRNNLIINKYLKAFNHFSALPVGFSRVFQSKPVLLYISQ